MKWFNAFSNSQLHARTLTTATHTHTHARYARTHAHDPHNHPDRNRLHCRCACSGCWHLVAPGVCLCWGMVGIPAVMHNFPPQCLALASRQMPDPGRSSSARGEDRGRHPKHKTHTSATPAGEPKQIIWIFLGEIQIVSPVQLSSWVLIIVGGGQFQF